MEPCSVFFNLYKYNSPKVLLFGNTHCYLTSRQVFKHYHPFSRFSFVNVFHSCVFRSAFAAQNSSPVQFVYRCISWVHKNNTRKQKPNKNQTKTSNNNDNKTKKKQRSFKFAAVCIFLVRNVQMKSGKAALWSKQEAWEALLYYVMPLYSVYYCILVNTFYNFKNIPVLFSFIIVSYH